MDASGLTPARRVRHVSSGERAGWVAVVDDDEAVLDSMQVLLEAEGYAVRTYRSGRQFLGDRGRGGCGCLLLDLHLPDMSGVQVVEALARAADGPPILCVTGAADAVEKQRAIRAGARAVLDKPVEARTLFGAVRAAFGRS
jgi:two-component system response regulator FixJ